MNDNIKIIVNNISRLNKHIFIYLKSTVIKDDKSKKAIIDKEDKIEDNNVIKENKTFKVLIEEDKIVKKEDKPVKTLTEESKKEEIVDILSDQNKKVENIINQGNKPVKILIDDKKEKTVEEIKPVVDKKEPRMLFGIKEEPRKEPIPQVTSFKPEEKKVIKEENKPVINVPVIDNSKITKKPIREIKPGPVTEIINESKKVDNTKEDKDTLELNIKEIENKINDRLYNSNYIFIDRIEKDIKELEDKVLSLQDKIINSDDPKEIEEYIKELKRIIEKINEILKELDRVNELIDIKVEDIKNEDEFLLKFDTYTNKLKKLEKEIIPKVEDEANIKTKLLEDLEKANEDKLSELDKQSLELELISKKLENDLNFYVELTKEIQRTTEVTERVERTYDGLNRLMNTFMHNMLLVSLVPHILRGPALTLAHINSTLNIAGEMLNPTFIEHRVYDRKVTVEEESDLVLDASEIKDIKKQVDDIGKKLDYIMSEVSKTFKGYEDKYKEIFDKLKDAKSIIDKQLEQINTLEKEKVKVLKIEKREE